MSGSSERHPRRVDTFIILMQSPWGGGGPVPLLLNRASIPSKLSTINCGLCEVKLVIIVKNSPSASQE
eukprot:CAMPEP_0169270362 /NCGR_PEP_ID=MMETSP1016-20121227/49061_1 /TAXON_ID=342587 /ORGANISM="Karlodinium micrum, Strain CCMP2283" /LENGTH=67 /DNA_ID=CAMNT_0009355671 /DNA_START=141 /DNA_END=344 /DNA_ORIENTATION=-